MIRPFVFFLLFLYTATCLAQEGYSVIYKSDDRFFPVTFNGERRRLPGIRDRLIFADTLSLYYRIPDGKDPFKKSKAAGDKIYHHSLLYNFNTSQYYSGVAWPVGKQKYLIKDSLKNETWDFSGDSKDIMGFRCRSALYVSPNKDSTLVWFTDSIPKPAGPSVYVGFPGLVLEVYDQSRRLHLVAIKIEKGEFYITMPKEGIIISPEEFRKLKR
ncbi:MAG: GLPGLI family protein [Chitinophagaceae bacterium]